MSAATNAPVLTVADLKTRFKTRDGVLTAVDGVGFSIARGETLGVVGESGSGKSQMLFSVLGLLAGNGWVEGSVRLEGEELIGADSATLLRVRGTKMAMVFQDPMTALNPYLTIERQLTEVLTYHRGLSRTAARAEALHALERVHISDAARQLTRYPHELSGGMRQRVVLAMAILGQPVLLLADEPTTALDVTIQAEILDLIEEQQHATGAAVILVTHDLGIVARLCSRVMVMYAGRVVEEGPVDDLLGAPRHPYTKALLSAVPRLDDDSALRRAPIEGQPPNLLHLPPGCSFAPRCASAGPRCQIERPVLFPTERGRSACFIENGGTGTS